MGDKEKQIAWVATGAVLVLAILIVFVAPRKPPPAGSSTTSIFGATSSGQEFVGRWSQPRQDEITGHPYTQYADISRNGSSFLLTFHGTYFKALQGTYPAQYENGLLQVGPLGSVALSEQANAIYVAGSTFRREAQ